MKTKTVKLSTLKPLERNPRRHGAVQIRELKRSLEKFGQIRPIVVDETNTVLAGNGLLLAMLEGGYEEADVLQMPGLSENDKKRFVLADNKIAGLGADDYGVVQELIHELSDELDIPGFDNEALQALVALPIEIKETASSYGVMSEEEIEKAKAYGQKIAASNKKSEETSAGQPLHSVCEACGQTIWS